MKTIDTFLNRVTMYRLVVYVLSAFAALGIVFAFLGHLSVSPTQLVASLGLLIGSAYAVDRIFARMFRVPTNMESSLITALILFLIVQPATSTASALLLVLAGGLSSAAKFIISWNGKHIFNPAAFAAAFLSLLQLQPVTWWIGSSIFWPFTLVLGLAVVRKIRRVPLFITFIAIAIGVQAVLFALSGSFSLVDMKHAIFASPLIFLASIMLTEPATMPPRRNLQVVFAGLVAVLYVGAWKLGPLTLYPEVALLLGNIFAFIVSPKFKVRLKLQEIQQISDRVYNYVFLPDRRFAFTPGQYMEWTLPGVPYDARGNRRSFTIASSPTEQTVQLGVKYYQPASMFKATLAQMQPGDIVYGSQLSGNFTLAGHERQKLAFIAGGVGITPFRSMIKALTDTKTPTDLTLIYVVADPKELAYMHEFAAAEPLGVRVVPIVTDPAMATSGIRVAQLSSDLIRELVPDYAARSFYLSGPNAMVDATKAYLTGLGITRGNIKTDHFSGY